jgi:hypothetical protein
MAASGAVVLVEVEDIAEFREALLWVLSSTDTMFKESGADHDQFKNPMEIERL